MLAYLSGRSTAPSTDLHSPATSLLRACAAVMLTLGLSACGLEFGDSSDDSSAQVPETGAEAPVAGNEPPAEDPGQVVSATLSWDIPTERENGDPLDLSEIGGYEIAFKRADAEEYDVLIVDDHTAQSLTIPDLTSGDYEFKIASFDTDGMYGQYSELIRASI